MLKLSALPPTLCAAAVLSAMLHLPAMPVCKSPQAVHHRQAKSRTGSNLKTGNHGRTGQKVTKLNPAEDFVIIAKVPGNPTYAYALKDAFKKAKISMGCIGSGTYSVYAYRKDRKRADAIIKTTAAKQGYRPEIYWA